MADYVLHDKQVFHFPLDLEGLFQTRHGSYMVSQSSDD